MNWRKLPVPPNPGALYHGLSPSVLQIVANYLDNATLPAQVAMCYLHYMVHVNWPLSRQPLSLAQIWDEMEKLVKEDEKIADFSTEISNAIGFNRVSLDEVCNTFGWFATTISLNWIAACLLAAESEMEKKKETKTMEVVGHLDEFDHFVPNLAFGSEDSIVSMGAHQKIRIIIHVLHRKAHGLAAALLEHCDINQRRDIIREILHREDWGIPKYPRFQLVESIPHVLKKCLLCPAVEVKEEPKFSFEIKAMEILLSLWPSAEKVQQPTRKPEFPPPLPCIAFVPRLASLAVEKQVWSKFDLTRMLLACLPTRKQLQAFSTEQSMACFLPSVLDKGPMWQESNRWTAIYPTFSIVGWFLRAFPMWRIPPVWWFMWPDKMPNLIASTSQQNPGRLKIEFCKEDDLDNCLKAIDKCKYSANQVEEILCKFERLGYLPSDSKRNKTQAPPRPSTQTTAEHVDHAIVWFRRGFFLKWKEQDLIDFVTLCMEKIDDDQIKRLRQAGCVSDKTIASVRKLARAHNLVRVLDGLKRFENAN